MPIVKVSNFTVVLNNKNMTNLLLFQLLLSLQMLCYRLSLRLSELNIIYRRPLSCSLLNVVIFLEQTYQEKRPYEIEVIVVPCVTLSEAKFRISHIFVFYNAFELHCWMPHIERTQIPDYCRRTYWLMIAETLAILFQHGWYMIKMIPYLIQLPFMCYVLIIEFISHRTAYHQ